MHSTLESFALGCRDILAMDNTPAGRERATALLRKALRDAAFVRELFGAGVTERTVLYRDSSLGFQILAHEHHGEKQDEPHDHGRSWAIYGQAEGETVMTDFQLLEPSGSGRRGKVRRVRSYTLRPGDAHVYNEGAIHAPAYCGLARLIRVEGTDLTRAACARYDEGTSGAER